MKAEALRIGVICEEGGLTYVHTMERSNRFTMTPHSEVLLRLMALDRLDQLWLHPSWSAHYAPAFWDIARAKGWTVQLRAQLPGWATCYYPGRYGAREVSIPALDNRAPWAEARSGLELLQALTLFENELGIPYRFGPGSTGTALMRKVHEGGTSRKVELEPLREVPPPAREGGTENPFAWTRQLEVAELDHRYLYAWDKNAAFLGACSSLELGLGEAEHVDAPAFDHRLPGYWECVTRPWLLDNLPDPLRPVGTSRQGHPMIWLTTPTVALARELGVLESITSAWVWKRHSRVLSPFYEVMRTARSQLGDVARAGGPDAGAARVALGAVKVCYSQGIGWLDQYATDAHGETLHRPDWRHAVVAQARANHFRKLAKVASFGHQPFAVMNDCDYYLSDVDDAEAARPAEYQLGDGLGCYKLHDAVAVDSVRDVLAGLCDTDAGRRWQAFRALQRRLNELRQGA